MSDIKRHAIQHAGVFIMYFMSAKIRMAIYAVNKINSTPCILV
ncbi:MAG: hypothetical protein Q8Q54_15800 [Methylococcales bacterium]|nr:hypothetical protein [Methylococcales bacterium]